MNNQLHSSRKFISLFYLLVVFLSPSGYSQTTDVDKLARKVVPGVVKWRRHFHENPELSNREFKTSAYIPIIRYLNMNSFKIVSYSLFFLLGNFHLITAHAENNKPPPIPDTEIYLFDVVYQGKTIQLKNATNISNHAGYDNQPFFTPDDHSVLFASERDGKQTDIYEYFIANGNLKQITHTAFMEYSPMTSADNQSITFVRDGENPNQTIWKMDRQTGKSVWAIHSLEPVGYYAFGHSGDEVLFWSRYGFNVTYLNLNKKTEFFVSGHAIPSSPKLIPNSHEFSFVHRQTNETVWIKTFNPETKSISPILPVNGTNFDYCWTPKGNLLRTEGTVLYLGNIINGWAKIADFKHFKLHRITRLALSSDGKKLAVVDNL